MAPPQPATAGPPRMTGELVAAAAIACLATIALVAAHAADPERRAMRHYIRHHPVAYHVMQACMVLLGCAIAYNARYVLLHALRLGVHHAHRLSVRR